MVEEGSRDGIDVGEGVLGLSVLGEDSRGDLEELRDERRWSDSIAQRRRWL